MANNVAQSPVTVEPRNATVAAAATPVPVEPTNPDTATAAQPSKNPSNNSLPDEVLQIPAMQAVFAGAPPAVSAPLKEFSKRPEAKLIAANKDALMRAGMGLYRSLGGDLGVIFNQLRISGAQLQAADKAGQLLQIAPSFDSVNQQVSSSGEANPVLSASAPSGPAGAPVPEPPQMNSPVTSPPPASAQRATTAARLRNLTLGGPSSGPQPGAGRVVNTLSKPVI